MSVWPGLMINPAHKQNEVLDVIEQLQPSVVKAFAHTTSGPWWAEAAKRSPRSRLVLIPHEITDSGDLSRPAADSDAIASLIDKNPGMPRCSISKNEILYCTDPISKWNQVRDYLCAFLERQHRNGIATVVGEINTGHPYVSLLDQEDQWPRLKAVDDAMSSGDAWGLHEYWSAPGPREWYPWTVGRHRRCPFNRDILIDECGYDKAVGLAGAVPQPRGWNGNLSADDYASQLIRFHQTLVDPRVKGTAIFEYDYDNREWFSFALDDIMPRLLARKAELSQTDASMYRPTSIAAPLDGRLVVTAKFGEKNAYTSWHLGTDFSCPIGTPVRCGLDGIVDKVADLGSSSYGRYVTVVCGGVILLYAHLTNAAVAKGQKVQRGQVIGYSGNTGYSSGPHLHMEVQDLSSHDASTHYRLNPEALISGGSASMDEEIRNVMVNSIAATVPIPYLPTAALALRARDERLGAPLTGEKDVQGWRCQGYANGIVCVKIPAPGGSWNTFRDLSW